MDKKIDSKKKKVDPEKYFRQAASIWIRVYGELVPPDPETGEVADPSFWKDGAEKRNLKLILTSLRDRAESRGVEWTEENMAQRFEAFIRKAWEDDFVYKNFMLRMINNNKVKFFNNQITPKRNAGNINSKGASSAPVVTTKPKGGFGSLFKNPAK